MYIMSLETEVPKKFSIQPPVFMFLWIYKRTGRQQSENRSSSLAALMKHQLRTFYLLRPVRSFDGASQRFGVTL